MPFNIFRKSKLSRRKFEGARDKEVRRASQGSGPEGMSDAARATTSSPISSKEEGVVPPVTVVPATWPDMAGHAKDTALRAQLIAWFQDPRTEKLDWHVSLGGLILQTAMREYLLYHLKDQNSLRALPDIVGNWTAELPFTSYCEALDINLFNTSEIDHKKQKSAELLFKGYVGLWYKHKQSRYGVPLIPWLPLLMEACQSDRVVREKWTDLPEMVLSYLTHANTRHEFSSGTQTNEQWPMEQEPKNVEKSSSATLPPATNGRLLTTVEVSPATVEEPPAVDVSPVVEKSPTTIEVSPAIVEEPPAVEMSPVVEKSPTTVEELPTTIKKLPATGEELPTTVGKLPSAIEKSPSVEESPAVEGSLAVKKPKSLAVEKLPATTGKPPVTFEKSPAVEKSLAVEKSPTTVEKPPATIDKSPAAGERLSASQLLGLPVPKAPAVKKGKVMSEKQSPPPPVPKEPKMVAIPTTTSIPVKSTQNKKPVHETVSYAQKLAQNLPPNPAVKKAGPRPPVPTTAGGPSSIPVPHSTSSPPNPKSPVGTQVSTTTGERSLPWYTSYIYERRAKGNNFQYKSTTTDNAVGNGQTFRWDVFLDGKLIGSGLGPSKKEAKHRASKEAWESLNK